MATLELHPIFPDQERNSSFQTDPNCLPYLEVWTGFYKQIGFQTPWIGYFAKEGTRYVGTCAFKGPPKEGRVEIAYGTFEKEEGRGVGTRMCANLVRLALSEKPDVVVTARTLPEENASTRILGKNQFVLLGVVEDPEDGEVWEWEYRGVENGT